MDARQDDVVVLSGTFDVFDWVQEVGRVGNRGKLVDVAGSEDEVRQEQSRSIPGRAGRDATEDRLQGIDLIGAGGNYRREPQRVDARAGGYLGGGVCGARMVGEGRRCRYKCDSSVTVARHGWSLRIGKRGAGAGAPHPRIFQEML